MLLVGVGCEWDACQTAGLLEHQVDSTVLHFEDPATYEGNHRVGEPGVWYASSTERGAWAELFRHWGDDEISPFEVQRRLGRARVADLAVLDLTDPEVRAQLGVTEGELTGDDVSRCQQLATEPREAGFEGILAPSATLDGETTLAVFATAMHKVVAVHSRVQRPPIRMIRVPDAAVDTVGRLYRDLAALGRGVRQR